MVGERTVPTARRRPPMWGLGLVVVAVSAGVVGFALTAGSASSTALPPAVEIPSGKAASPTTTLSAPVPTTSTVVSPAGVSPLSVVAAPKPVVTQVDGITATTVPVTTTTTEDSSGGHTTTTESEGRSQTPPSTAPTDR